MDFERHFKGKADYPLVLAFASDDGTRFEWGDFLGNKKFHHMLIRDSRSRQYTEGVLGIGNLAETILYINNVKSFYFKTVAIGLSNAGYGALYIGKLTQVEKVVCMSAVTGLYIKDEFDPKWYHRLIPRPGGPHIVDLKPLYQFDPKPVVKAFIGNGYGTELDRQMVERIGVTDITELNGVSHADVGKIVRDNGMLEKAILE